MKGMIQHYRIEIQIRRQWILRFGQAQLPKWHREIHERQDRLKNHPNRVEAGPEGAIRVIRVAPLWVGKRVVPLWAGKG